VKAETGSGERGEKGTERARKREKGKQKRNGKERQNTL